MRTEFLFARVVGPVRRSALALAAVVTLVAAGCGSPPDTSPQVPVNVDTAVPDSTDTTPPTSSSPPTTTPATTTVPVETVVPAPPPVPKPKPAPKPNPKPKQAPKPPAPKPAPRDCDPSYPTVCIPSAPPDLDCGDIPHKRFPVRAPDPHGFDGNDNDGVGCES